MKELNTRSTTLSVSLHFMQPLERNKNKLSVAKNVHRPKYESCSFRSLFIHDLRRIVVTPFWLHAFSGYPAIAGSGRTLLPVFLQRAVVFFSFIVPRLCAELEGERKPRTLRHVVHSPEGLPGACNTRSQRGLAVSSLRSRQ